MGETQICFMDSFPVEFFCFHDNLNSFSFGGTRLPVSGFSETTPNTALSRGSNQQPQAQEAVLSPDLQGVGSHKE